VFFPKKVYIKNKVVGHNVNSNNQPICRQTCVCDQLICTLNTYNVHETDLQIPKEKECAGMNQRPRVRKLNEQCAVKNVNNHDPSLTQSIVRNRPLKIFHQNIMSLRFKMNELLCHLNHDPPNILRITKHHLRHEELAAFHVENYVLGSSYCRQLKLKGGVCIFVQNNLKFTPLNVDEYCVDQDI